MSFLQNEISTICRFDNLFSALCSSTIWNSTTRFWTLKRSAIFSAFLVKKFPRFRIHSQCVVTTLCLFGGVGGRICSRTFGSRIFYLDTGNADADALGQKVCCQKHLSTQQRTKKLDKKVLHCCANFYIRMHIYEMSRQLTMSTFRTTSCQPPAGPVGRP
jgi:hypothetical protein